MPPIVETQGLPPRHRDAFTRMFARAFGDKPIFRYMLPDDATRHDRVRWLAARKMQLQGHRYTVFTAEDPVQGFACWFPPGTSPRTSLMSQLLAGYGAAPFKFGLGTFSRMTEVGAHEQKMLALMSKEPAWILDVLQVDPGVQRQGLGGRLLAPVFQRAEEQGVPCWVLTNNDDNVPFYERQGFTLMHQDPVVPGGPMASCLRR